MTYQEAVDALAAWNAAMKAVATGTSYSIGGRSLTRADIPDIRDQITYYTREIKRLVDPANPDTPGESTWVTPSWR
jgi:hypothetical protein